MKGNTENCDVISVEKDEFGIQINGFYVFFNNKIILNSYKAIKNPTILLGLSDIYVRLFEKYASNSLVFLF